MLAIFGLFHVPSLLWLHPRTIKVFPAPFYLWRCSHEKKKYQAFHVYTTSMFEFWSVGAWE